MKIPYWNDVITLYRREEAQDGSVSWERSMHSGCFFQQRTMRERINGAELQPVHIVCRIPAPFPDVRVGDIIIRGEINDEIDEYAAGKRSADLLKRYAGEAMLVGEVHRNARGLPFPDHLYAGG